MGERPRSPADDDPLLEDPLTAEVARLSEPALNRSGPQSTGWACETGFVSDLLVRCGRQDQGALARLFDLLSPLVTAAVSMSVDPPRVGDRVRDVFVELWRDAPDYRAGTSSVGWIMERVSSVSSRPE